MNKTISDERIISSLLSHDTRKAAAKSLGIKSETLANRMMSDSFREKYQAAKDELVKDVVTTVQSNTMKAVNTIFEIMENPGNLPQIRLKAAELIIGYSIKFTETEDLLKRVEELEELERIEL